MDIFETAKLNKVKELRELLKFHDPNQQDSRGSTPLIIAAYYNNTEAVKCLVDYGVALDVKDNMGNTALMGVCFKGFLDCARMLLESGANVDERNDNGATALTFAATFGHLDIVGLLTQFKANVITKDRFGKNPIDYAMVQENDKCYEYLVAHMKQINKTELQHNA